MYPKTASRLVHAPSLKRWDIAYEDKRRPIGWGETDREAVGLLQLYLWMLNYKTKRSVLISNHGRHVNPDGVFGGETLESVKQFQRDMKLKDDGMVGPNTMDALGLMIDPPRSAVHGFVQQIEMPTKRIQLCPPNTLICPDPDARPR